MLQDRVAHSSRSSDKAWGKASAVLGGAVALVTLGSPPPSGRAGWMGANRTP